MATVKVGDLNIHYVEQGSGESVILIHGNTSSSVWWEYTFERLKDAPYRLIAPDLRGRGDTDGPSAHWTVEMLAADIIGLAQALKLDRFHLVGHSLGACVALQLALDHKPNVLSLTLLNPGWVAGDMPAAVGDQARIEQMIANKDLLKMALRGVAALHPDNDAWKRLEAASLKQRDEASLQGVAALKSWNVVDRLPKLGGIPTLVTRGTGDLYLSTEDVALKSVNGIPGARYEVIPNATHSPNVENPDAWAALLRQHLDRVKFVPGVLPDIRVKRVSSSRLSTRVLFSGPDDGIPVLFLHGNASSATYWEETMLALPDGYRGIAPDQRGYGEADLSKKVDATRGTSDWSDDAVALLDALGISAAHLVGHSLGGTVVFQLLIDAPNRALSATVVNPGSPYGFGGSKDVDGTPNYPDFAGSGGGVVNPEFARLMGIGDRGSDNPQASPRIVMNRFYYKPPFRAVREEDLLTSLLSEHGIGEQYPGDLTPSENWPNVAPGIWGPINAVSPKYAGDVSRLYRITPKPRVLWVRGSHDQIVSDNSLFDLGTLGMLGAVPGWPGNEVYPPQPMVSQVRAILDKYATAGGAYTEVVIADTGHTPYIEKPAEFNDAFHTHLKG